MKKGKKNKIFAVLCDGIGGLQQGEQASSYVVRQLGNWFMSEGCKKEVKKQKNILQQLCFQIHEEMKSYGRENGIRLGTTLTCVFMDDKVMLLLHCGDCRLYLLRNGRIRKLTIEHHDDTGHLNHALGAGQWKRLYVKCLKVKKHDRFLLCTDGLYRNLGQKDLHDWAKKEIESDARAERMLKQLYEKKISQGEKDNISGIYFGYLTRKINQQGEK